MKQSLIIGQIHTDTIRIPSICILAVAQPLLHVQGVTSSSGIMLMKYSLTDRTHSSVYSYTPACLPDWLVPPTQPISPKHSWLYTYVLHRAQHPIKHPAHSVPPTQSQPAQSQPTQPCPLSPNPLSPAHSVPTHSAPPTQSQPTQPRPLSPSLLSPAHSVPACSDIQPIPNNDGTT